MSKVGELERKAQARVVEHFTQALDYRYLGNLADVEGNANVRIPDLETWLRSQGHDEDLIQKVVTRVQKAAALGSGDSLYDANREVYQLLRYGVKVSPSVGEQMVTVYVIDWANPANNDFAVAEEVTLKGKKTKRPDLVLYVNGIALGVIELKRSTVSVSEGIRQAITNQDKQFIRPFFTTVQLVMAGNETEGLRYSVIETREKYWLHWKEEGVPETGESRLLSSLSHLCAKPRLLEVIHDFMVFDAGTKKTCRHNQYFGVKKAQERVQQRVGGIIWHTQGSGKSLTMVWLAKWIRENIPNSRVLIVTDRTELDEQIEQVFRGVNEDIYRTKSGADLVDALGKGERVLVCSLIHKFGASDEGDVDRFIADLESHKPKDFRVPGEVFVFVDECHRTQSGKLHRALKAMLPGSMLVGFTGTPLLKVDQKSSIETFGPYIHTYKYDQAVADGVVLDLRYEARDIDQRLSSAGKIDEWFASRTKGMTDYARAKLKQRWGTLQTVQSAKERLEKIVVDIVFDMATKPRLADGRGNALLVSGSIYSACRLYEMFQSTELKGRCAIVTSYRPNPSDIAGESSGEGLTERMRQYAIYRKMLAEFFGVAEDAAAHRTEEFEKGVKKRFINDPGQMKLLIVVDKLLTGFDAPPATYLYIDKPMQDHGLFQAICRVNRLDGDDKTYGHIIDYRDLFRSLEQSIKDYTGEALSGYDEDDVRGLLKNRLDAARERLNEALESVRALCEPVMAPRDTAAYIAFFCANGDHTEEQAKAVEQRRMTLYKMVGTLLGAYEDIADEMAEAKYSEAQADSIAREVRHFEQVRIEIRLASTDYIDLKMYEPAMRHMLDTYIRADDSEKVSVFDDMSLVQLLAKQGEEAVESLPKGIREDKRAVAETIENNVRRLIVDEMAVNPRYFELMSKLLDELIKARKQGAIEYREYLKRIAELAKRVAEPDTTQYPASVGTPAQRALFDNLQEAVTSQDEGDAVVRAASLAVLVDAAILDVKKDGWRGSLFKTKEVQKAIRDVLRKGSIDASDDMVGMILEIAKNQRDY